VNFSMTRIAIFAGLILALSTLALAPQLRADSFHENNSMNFDHQNFNEGNFHPSFFDNSDKKDDKDNGNNGFGFGFGNDSGDNHDFDGTPGPSVVTPEPAIFVLLFSGLAGILALATLKKA
jgi:hypothetical protein